MAQERYVTKIRTADGDSQIDYNALANLPNLDNFVTQTEISAISESVDGLSEDVAALSKAVADEKTRAEGAEAAMAVRLQSVESAVGETGSVSTAIADAVADAKKYTDDAVSAVSLMDIGVTATAAELNVLDGITATTTELNYVDGVTSNIQAQLNNKANSAHTHTATEVGALPITGGTLTGTSAVTDAAVRNIKAGTAALTAGSSALTTGVIYVQYE